jgi:hypothetical protein
LVSQLLAATPVVTGKDFTGAIKTVLGFGVVGVLLFVAAYGGYSAFMLAGTLRQRLTRGILAIGAIVAIVYITPIFWGPRHQ